MSHTFYYNIQGDRWTGGLHEKGALVDALFLWLSLSLSLSLSLPFSLTPKIHTHENVMCERERRTKWCFMRVGERKKRERAGEREGVFACVRVCVCVCLCVCE